MHSIEQHIAISVLRLVVMVAAVLGNALILFVVLKNRKLRQRGANLLFAQLALADLLIGVGVGIRATATIVFNRLNTTIFRKGDCLTIGILAVFAIHLSQATMMAIAFDRFLCIQFPLFYRNSETLRFATFRFVLCAIFSLLGTSLVYFDLRWDDQTALCAFGSSIPLWYISYWNFFSTIFTLLIYALYITIFVVYKTRIQTIHSATQRTLFRTITAVLVSYFLLWCVPNFSIVAGNLLGASPAVFGYLSFLVAFGSGFNASTNIFIYGWKHSELGSCMRKTLSTGLRYLLFCRSRGTEPRSSIFLSTDKVTTERKITPISGSYGFEFVDK
ncbi:hypothetical protein QR680_008624 [Steinernema hermaphroditum]|uniref:G-protein coupled receptors family 1 profile domain-containing protein n=1 Tax=Steinernema hermaphroditum TaxID=289476 RepID=A0AA39IJI5_9BILA|nr:hypothetical protein QR680_008624 [Steinernema hermaphroditum]